MPFLQQILTVINGRDGKMENFPMIDHCFLSGIYDIGSLFNSKLVRFAHNWNVGILEYWNIGFWDNGMMGLENQNEYNCIDFLVIVAYFLWRKQKMDV